MNGNASAWTNYIQFRSTDGQVTFPSTISAPASFQRGFVSVQCSANAVSKLHVNFNQAFSGVPKVFVNPLTTVPGSNVLGCNANNITASGFDIYIYRKTAASTGVDWFAIYV